jgi:hypothetical protein
MSRPVRRVIGTGACEQCGSAFEMTDERVRFCSRGCTLRAVRPHAAHPASPYLPKRVRACRHCGQELSGNSTVLCSPACRDADKRVRHLWPARPAFVCRECGSTHQPRQGERSRTYCSDACCASWMKKTPAYRDQRSRHAHQRRVRLANGAPGRERVYRMRIFERDGWRCQLCHRLVRRDVLPTHGMAPTLDHILPVSAGGAHEALNVQTAHFICNARRRDVGPAQLRLLA